MSYVPYGTSRTKAQALELLELNSITVPAPYDLENPCKLWQGFRVKGGYGRIRCEGATHYIHRLICEGEVVRHKCDRPNCWEESHLEAGTHADNVADKVAKGRHGHGVTHYKATLTEEDVVGIRTSRKQGTPLKVIAEAYGVGLSCVKSVVYGSTWKHVR